MLLSAVSVLVVAQSSSEIPEGLMNNPVYLLSAALWMCLVHCYIVRNCTLLVSSFMTLYTGDMYSRKLYNFRFVLLHSLMPQDCQTVLYSIGIRNFYMFFIVISPLLRVEIRSVGCGRRVANCLWGGTDKAACTR